MEDYTEILLSCLNIPLGTNLSNFDFGTLMIAVSAALRTPSTIDLRLVAVVVSKSIAFCAVSSSVHDDVMIIKIMHY